MRKDSRLSRVLHVLIHLNSYSNPVVVRRTMALLRQAGYVSAIKGHNGYWPLP